MQATHRKLMRRHQIAALVFSGLMTGSVAYAKTTPVEPETTQGDPLLEVLLKNGVINKNQYKQLGSFNNNALLEILAHNGAITKDQAKTLTINGGNSPKAAEAPTAPAQAPVLKNAPAPNPNDGYARVNEKGIEWGSNDGAFKAKIGGRVQIDSEINWNDPNTPKGADLANGVAIRRARLFVEGLMYKDYEYRFEYDFTRNNGGTQGITDALSLIHI